MPSILNLKVTIFSEGSMCMSEASSASAPAMIISSTSEIFLDSFMEMPFEINSFKAGTSLTFSSSSLNFFWETPIMPEAASTKDGTSGYRERALLRLISEIKKSCGV